MRFQDKVLQAIQQVVEEDCGLEFVDERQYSNTGHWHAVRGFTTVMVGAYSFQDSYMSTNVTMGNHPCYVMHYGEYQHPNFSAKIEEMLATVRYVLQEEG